MKTVSPHILKQQGYTYYSEVNDWIKWDGDTHVDDVDGGWAWGGVSGTSIEGKEYSAGVEFMWMGDWEIQEDTISDIELN